MTYVALLFAAIFIVSTAAIRFALDITTAAWSWWRRES